MIQSWENVDRFEEIVAEYTGAEYGVATDSCTNSIFLCLKYYDHIRKGLLKRPVHVPRNTYLSVPMAVKHAGYEVEFKTNKWSGVYDLSPYPIVDSATRFSRGMFSRDGLPPTQEFMCLSFHTKKHIPIGRGGMILTNNREAVTWLKQARFDGRKSMFFNDIVDVDVMGYHMYMTPEQAARGIELFYRLPEDNDDLATWESYPDISRYTCFKTV